MTPTDCMHTCMYVAMDSSWSYVFPPSIYLLLFLCLICTCSHFVLCSFSPSELQAVTYSVPGSSGLSGIEDRVYKMRPGCVCAYVSRTELYSSTNVNSYTQPTCTRTTNILVYLVYIKPGGVPRQVMHIPC